MNSGALLLVIAVGLITAAFVLYPFVVNKRFGMKSASRTSNNSQTLNQQISSLLAQKEQMLTVIQELDFDRDTGKLPEDLYQSQRVEMLQKAAGILKQLDDLGYQEPEKKTSSSKKANGNKDYDDLDELIARRKLAKTSKAEGFCSKCGNAIQANDRFCPKCGKTIER